jgi:hypothetical protein
MLGTEPIDYPQVFVKPLRGRSWWLIIFLLPIFSAYGTENALLSSSTLGLNIGRK